MCAVCRHGRFASGELCPSWSRCLGTCRFCAADAAVKVHRVLEGQHFWHGAESSAGESSLTEDDSGEEDRLREDAVRARAAMQEQQEGDVPQAAQGPVEDQKKTVAMKRRLRKKRVAEKWKARRKAGEAALEDVVERE
jgi:hypothetical protein